MKTFIFCEGNSSAVLTISARSEEEAREEMRDLGLNDDNWRLDEEEDEDDE